MPPSGIYTYYPDTLEVPERSAANTHGVSYRILAEVELTDDAEGVIMAHGSRFGGHSLFVKDHRLHYVYNFLGIAPEQHLSGEAALSPGKHILGVEFEKRSAGEHGESHGVATTPTSTSSATCRRPTPARLSPGGGHVGAALLGDPARPS